MDVTIYSLDTISSILKDKKTNDLILFKCPLCDNSFTRTKKRVITSACDKVRQIFCSKKCQYQASTKCKVFSCFVCEKEFTRTPGEIRSEKLFCSRSCSAKYYNKSKLKYNSCKECGSFISHNNVFCQKCRDERFYKLDKPINLLFNLNKRASKYSTIRYHARKFYLENFKHECLNCKYSLHIEVAHIRAISEFPEDSPLGEVNSSDNLVALCKRCHWELDNGYLDINLLSAKHPLI